MNPTERERLLRNIREAQKKDQEEIKVRDEEMKAKGFTHRVAFWDHCTGGDDEQCDSYFSGDPRNLKINDGEAWDFWQEIKTASIGDFKVIEL